MPSIILREIDFDKIPGFSNSLYKGFIVVNNIVREIVFNEIPVTYFKL